MIRAKKIENQQLRRDFISKEKSVPTKKFL